MKTFFIICSVFLAVLSVVVAAEFQGDFDISTGGDNITIGGTCTESWSGFWTTCQNHTQTFVCVDANNCGTDEFKPAQCDTEQACDIVTSSSSSSSGGGGGGSSSSSSGGGVIVLGDTGKNSEPCIEEWICEDWSDAEGACGTRECYETNDCGTEELKPLTEKICESKKTKGLFSTLFGPTGAAVALDSYGNGFGSLLLIALVIALVLFVKKGTKKLPVQETPPVKAKPKRPKVDTPTETQ